MNNVCLIVVFNHSFIENIDKLKQYYKGKFSAIKFIVPFYNGDDDSVIGVYENSHRFQGYITQAFNRFYKDEFSHYIFAADDLLLNPALNEHCILEKLNISKDTSYIKHIFTFDQSDSAWHIIRTFNAYLKKSGVEADAFLPGYAAAVSQFNKHHIPVNKISFFRFCRMILHKDPKYVLKNMIDFFQYIFLKKGKNISVIPYPFAGAYSDFLIVPKSTIKQFVHYCGIFSAMNIFVEVAIPTALILSSADIKQESDCKGIEIWDKDTIEKLAADNEYKVTALFKDENILYYHPIKLSKWNIN